VVRQHNDRTAGGIGGPRAASCSLAERGILPPAYRRSQVRRRSEPPCGAL